MNDRKRHAGGWLSVLGLELPAFAKLSGEGSAVSSSDAPDARNWLAAIIDGSDDAIVSKNLEGVIQTWNGGATRLFGYLPEEVIGQPVTILIPPDRLDEEPMILAQIHAGKRVDHFETKRRRKDGSLVDISLTISPIRNEHGIVVGASKIARDISERMRAQEQQRLLMGEMQHRVKNLFALANAVVSISSRSSSGQADIIANIRSRLSSLALAHDLIMADRGPDAAGGEHVSLLKLVSTILEPYSTGNRVSISGDDCHVRGRAVTDLALLLHELATNAAKYGALSNEEGRIDVVVSAAGDQICLLWKETGGPPPSLDKTAGFGSRLEQGLASSLGAVIRREWPRTGLVASITVMKSVLADH